MSEAKRTLPIDALVDNDPAVFGPGKAETEIFQHILDDIDQGNDVGFRPRVVAELTSTLIDRGRGGCFINSDAATTGLDDAAAMKLAQQRYVCGVLGLRLGPLDISPESGTASFTIDLPEENLLPPRPQKNPNGSFTDASGKVISAIKGDAIYAAHFIAGHREYFSQPSRFEDMFRRVVEQAEQGRLEVTDRSGDVKGAMSTVRQMARVMGYQVGDFAQDSATSKYFGDVTGIRKGFDDKNTHFKRAAKTT